MRRERRVHGRSENNKSILYIAGSILGMGIIAFVITFVVYGNKMEAQSEINAGKIASLMQEKESITEEASIRNGQNSRRI